MGGTVLGIAAAAYGTVLLAELLGDRSIYTIGSLTMRFRVLPVLAGIGPAFALKMAVAVMAGRVIAALSPAVIAAISSLMFLATAVVLWCRRVPDEAVAKIDDARWIRAAALSFSSILLTEWADAGQIAAAAVTARFGHPLPVWGAATAAMMTKGMLATAVGVALRRRIPESPLRYAAAGICLVMSVLSAIGTR